ncbi:amidohydrolase family protein, partial [Kitasatospora sp. NPDC089797]|uniref:amidohydrolase family protein n=1 Tax=Kitasatospora sp. NPDC089797 TaxID=3155298 RepID=UPI00343B6200
MISSRTVLSGARLVLPGGVVEGDRLAVEGERIAVIASGAAEPGDLDLTGHTVVPGFVDLHVHGGGGASYASGIAEEALLAARTHLEHGTTTTMASTVTGEIDEVARQAAVLSELVEDGVLAGIHFEGPFISHNRCGAHRPDLLRNPDPA